MPQGVGSSVKPSIECDESLITFWRLAATAGYITKTAGDGGRATGRVSRFFETFFLPDNESYEKYIRRRKTCEV